MCPSFCNEECMTDVKINKPTISTEMRPVYTSTFQVYFPKAAELTIAPQIIEDPTAAPGLFFICFCLFLYL